MYVYFTHNYEFLVIGQRVVPRTLLYALGVKRLRGFLIYRVTFEVLPCYVQIAKRWVTLLAVQQGRYAKKNPLRFEVSALVLMNLYSTIASAVTSYRGD